MDIENLLAIVVEDANSTRPYVLRHLDGGHQGLRVQLAIYAEAGVLVVSGAILAPHVYVF